MIEAYKQYYIAMWNLFKETWWMFPILLILLVIIYKWKVR